MRLLGLARGVFETLGKWRKKGGADDDEYLPEQMIALGENPPTGDNTLNKGQ
jgi:hypothetical protein